ncbi:hypothetical protein ANN_26210 [Periplaneta americana]|uniref:Uncharacterized protein n=1 Tax=Periplaneta americana TaxID=6978 RepID=A0ABQ8S5A2_PERAM|nr:hypothetical protein ANN_26210 [Periplaneta americana]
MGQQIRNKFEKVFQNNKDIIERQNVSAMLDVEHVGTVVSVSGSGSAFLDVLICSTTLLTAGYPSDRSSEINPLPPVLDDLLERTVTEDETWLHHFGPETEAGHANSPKK